MKHLLIIVISIVCFDAYCQTQNVKHEIQTIIQQRSIYLNGGARASLGGKSRTTIKVDLPPNTKSWHYSFSTILGESGTKNLNLAMQLSALAMAPSGITKAVLEQVEVPSGSACIDAYVLDQPNSDLFINKVDNNGGSFTYKREGSVFNTKQGVINIDDFTTGTYYIGLKNPSSLDAVNIFIEVVAVVEIVEGYSENQVQSITLGNLGWKAFERGDYQKCIDLSNKALSFDSTMAYIHFNIGVSQLMLGQTDQAIMRYAKAISIAKGINFPRKTLAGAIQDLNDNMSRFPSKEDANDLLFLLKEEIKHY